MPPSELMLIALSAALLIISVIGVRRRGRATPPKVEAPKETEAAPAAPPVQATRIVPVRPAFVPPEGSVMAAQLEVGQTIHIQTETAKYALTLLDPVTYLYDAVRTGRVDGGKVAKQRFKIFLIGSFVPYHRLMFGWFIPGGRLSYHKCDEIDHRGPYTSMAIQRVIFSIPLKQAS